MAKAIIDAGICGFITEVEAICTDPDDGIVELKINSACPNFAKLNETLSEVDGMTCVFSKIGTGEIYEACSKTCKHAACPVPMGIIKAVEVASGMALPKSVSVEITK